MARLVLTALVALLATGCFVFDELDKGMAISNQHAGANAAKPAAADGSAPDPDKPSLKDYWARATSLSSEAANESIVRCALRSGTQFTDREDCLGRGGRVE